MRLSFALFADAANISQEGKLNILGVFDALQVASVPTLHPRAALVMRIKGSPDDIGTHTVALRWLNPAGDELWSSVGELNVSGPPAGIVEMDFPLIAAIDLPIDQPGAFTMTITLDNENAGQLRLVVRSNAPILPTTGLVS